VETVPRFWVVRVSGGEFIEPCKKGKYVAIGWNELNDLSWLLDASIEASDAKRKLYDLYEKKLKKWHENKRQKEINTAQVYRFVKEIKNGDFILSPTTKRTILIGRIAGDYFPAHKQKDGCPYKQRRAVDWIKEVPRDDMSQKLRNSLGAHLTVFRLSGHDEELTALIEGKKISVKLERKYAEKAGEESVVGEVINFRGLVYAPINEQGVIFLFSKVSKDLNIEIEEIKTGFPDAIGRVKTSRGYARRTIEFEYKSSNYDHLPKKCDILVCWEHDWLECPEDIEVIALKDVIKELRQ
jgi:hypothetical protein